VWTKRHGVKAGQIIAIDAAYDAARDQRKDEAVGEDYGSGTQCRKDAMFDLIEKSRWRTSAPG